LEQFSEFIYRTLPFIGRVAFMAIEPIGKALKNIATIWIDPIDYSDNLSKAIRVLHLRKIDVMIFNHQLCTLPQDLWVLSEKAISDWKNVYSNECKTCIKKDQCGGFFLSGLPYRSRSISPIH